MVLRGAGVSRADVRVYLADNLGDLAGAAIFGFWLVFWATPVQALALIHLPLAVLALWLMRKRGWLPDCITSIGIGNVSGHPANHTYCPGCGQVVIRRRGFAPPEVSLRDGRCVHCGHQVAGVWDLPSSRAARK